MWQEDDVVAFLVCYLVIYIVLWVPEHHSSWEASKLQRLADTFRPAFRNLRRWTPLFVACFVLAYILWLVLKMWLRSRRASGQGLEREMTVAHSVESHLETELESEEDVNRQTLLRNGEGWLALAHPSPSCYAFPVPASTCTCRERLISGFDSYELPWERERHILEAHEGTLHGWGSRRQEEDSSPEHHRMTSPLSANLVRTPSSSSYYTYSSHSSSSPSSDGCHLKGWGWHPSEGSFLAASEGPSGTRPDSTDELESHVPGPSSKLHDPDLMKGKLEPPDVLLVPKRPPERERRVPRRRDIPVHLPEEAEPQALPRFAQLNVSERSAYGRKNGIVCLVRLLEIQMGPAPAPVAKPSHPKRTFPNQEVEEQKPTGLALCSVPEEATPRASPKTRQTPPRQQNRLVGSTSAPWKPREPKGEVVKKEASMLRSRSQDEDLSPEYHRTTSPLRADLLVRTSSSSSCSSFRTPPQQNRLVGLTCKAEDFDPEAFALKDMDEETIERLEYHAKKKMVQGWHGMPSVVIRSLRLFRALEDYRLERGTQKPTPKLQLRPVRAAARNHLNDPPSSPAKHLQRLPGNKASPILHPLVPERAKKLALSHPRVQLGRNRAAFHGPREAVILLSMDPDEHQQLLFHLQLKMADIKRGTFPAAVEDSFQRCGASLSLLPKSIHRRNKTPRPKELSMAAEALHLIERNIELHATSMAGLPRSSAPWQPCDPKGGVFKGKAHAPSLPFLILKHHRGKGLPASLEQFLRGPSSKKPPKLPPTPVALAAKAMSPGEEEALQSPTAQGCPPSPATSALEPPLEPPRRHEAATGRQDGRGGMEEAGSLQLELAEMPCCTALPPSEDVEALEQPLEPPRKDEAEETQPQGASSSEVPSLALNAEGGAAAAGAEGEERLPGTNAFLPSSIQGKAEAHKKGKRTRPETERGQPFRGGAPPPFDKGSGRAPGSHRESRRRGHPRLSSDQRGAKGERGRAVPKPGCIPCASLCLCLARAKEKVKLHLKKLAVKLHLLRPPHRVARRHATDLDPDSAAGSQSTPRSRD